MRFTSRSSWTRSTRKRRRFDRINATLTKEQKAKFKLRKQGGSSASEIMKHDQQEAYKKQ